jgi:N-acetylneuraminic acid mutarotase
MSAKSFLRPRALLVGLVAVLAVVLPAVAQAKWLNSPRMHEARAGHAAALLSDGRVLVMGGSNDTAPTLASTEVYDPAANSWTRAAPMALARSAFTASVLQDGRVLVAGGYGSRSERLSSVQVYDPATGGWSPLASLPTPRRRHAAVVLEDGRARLLDGRVLLAGGVYGDTSYWATTELYEKPTSP